MATKVKKVSRRIRIKRSIRKKISGTASRPRLTVFRSNRAVYAQMIDDVNGVTLVHASSIDLEGDRKSVNVEASKEVGKILAERAKTKGIEKAVFDRNGFLYHGKIKAMAEGAREGGIKF